MTLAGFIASRDKPLEQNRQLSIKGAIGDSDTPITIKTAHRPTKNATMRPPYDLPCENIFSRAISTEYTSLHGRRMTNRLPAATRYSSILGWMRQFCRLPEREELYSNVLSQDFE